MKRFIVLALAPIALIAGVHAAPAGDAGITVSTDPARAEAVERHAQELAARDAKVAAAKEKAARSHHRAHREAASTSGTSAR